MKTNSQVLKILLPLLMISFFYKPLMLVFLVIFIIYFFLLIFTNKLKIDLFSTIYVIFLFLTNICDSFIIQQNYKFIFNGILFFIFISPLLMLIVTDFKKQNLKTNKQNSVYTKKAIEIFLHIEIFFSFINGLKRAIEYKFRLDTNFGDIIAGTFRIPLIYTPDSANVVFSFTMVLVLFIYIVYFKKEANKMLVVLSIFTLFLASVNHIILAVGISLFLTLIWIYTTRVILLSIFISILYPILQPTNFRLIVERITLLLSSFSLESLTKLSLKGEFIYNFLMDFKENLIVFLFTGLGGGTYSSRASLFFTGEYVSSFPFTNISNYMKNNTYILWQELLNRPPWLAGSFNYPYGSIFSFIAELGLLNTLMLFVLLFKKLKETNVFTNVEISFILLFLFLVGFIDNYYEYFQAWLIFYIIIKNLPPKYYNYTGRNKNAI